MRACAFGFSSIHRLAVCLAAATASPETRPSKATTLTSCARARPFNREEPRAEVLYVGEARLVVIAQRLPLDVLRHKSNEEPQARLDKGWSAS